VGRVRLTSQGTTGYEVFWTSDVYVGTEFEYHKRMRDVSSVIVNLDKVLAYQDSLRKTFAMTVLHRLMGDVTQYQYTHPGFLRRFRL
jgi:hypothetical protein